jgi:hypothetical protein
MSLVSLSEAKARVGASVTQDMIDEAEEELTHRIGPLTGERTETFYLSQRRDKRIVDGLFLSRYTDTVTLTHDGDTLTSGTDFRLIGGHLVERIPDSDTGWSMTMVATYTPNDEERVRRAIYDLLDYASLDVGVQSVRIGDFSTSYFPRGVQTADELRHILNRVTPDAGLGAYAEPYRYYSLRRDRTLIEATGS